MGGSIYTKKQTLDVSPAEPEFTAEKMVQQQVADIQSTVQKQKEYEAKLIEKQKEFELKEQQKDIDFQNQLNRKQVDAILDNGATAYPTDIKGFNKYVNENLSKVFNSVTDEKEKIKLMAEASITYSRKETTILAETIKGKNKAYGNTVRDNVLITIDDAPKGISSIFEIADNNFSPDLKKKQEKAFIDASVDLKKAYDKKDMKDDNGNFIFTQAERKTIADAYENRAKNGLLQYTSDNIESNREGVIGTYNYLKSNRNEVMKKYGLDGKAYDETLDKMDKIINKESTYDIIKTEELFTNELAVMKDNKEDMFNVMMKLEDAYSKKLVDATFYQKNIGALKSNYYEKEKKDMFKKNSAGRIVFDTIKDQVPEIKNTIIDNENRYDMMLIYYKKMKELNIDVNSTDPSDILTVKAKVIPTVNREIAISLGAKESDLKDVNGFLKKNKSKTAKQRVIEVLEIDKFFKDNLK
jgi:hypothetical protein